MREYQIRPCSVLTFDEDKEKDLIATVNNLKDRKKLGGFITSLIRIALESPETYGSRNELNQVLAKIDELGITPCRYKYFAQLNKEVSDIRNKVDAIYNMAYETYMLAQMGKHLGLEEKSTNTLLASFILERQVSELCTALGTTSLNHTFAANKLEYTEKKAEETLKFIIETYDNILNELKKSLVPGNVVMVAQNPVSAQVDNDKNGITSVGRHSAISESHKDSVSTATSKVEVKTGDKDSGESGSEYSCGTVSSISDDMANALRQMMKKK